MAWPAIRSCDWSTRTSARPLRTRGVEVVVVSFLLLGEDIPRLALVRRVELEVVEYLATLAKVLLG